MWYIHGEGSIMWDIYGYGIGMWDIHGDRYVGYTLGGEYTCEIYMWRGIGIHVGCTS